MLDFPPDRSSPFGVLLSLYRSKLIPYSKVLEERQAWLIEVSVFLRSEIDRYVEAGASDIVKHLRGMANRLDQMIAEIRRIRLKMEE